MLVTHAAMMSSVIMYGIVAYTFAEGAPYARPAIDHRVVLAIACAVGAICAALSFVVRAKRTPPRALTNDTKFPFALLSTPPGRAALLKLRSTLILTWALVEAVAIAGLVPALLYQDTADYAPFGAV